MKRERILGAMEVDISRAIAAGESPRRIAERLLLIPELETAALSPRDPATALLEAARFLDDGFHERLVNALRSIAADLQTLDEPAAYPER